MTTKTENIIKVQFEEAEKKAIFIMANEVILADGTIHPNELEAMRQLEKEIGMDNNQIEEAKKTSVDEALVALHGMTYDKKKVLAQILEDMAIADKHLHDKEMSLIIQTFKNIGIGEETE